MSGLSALLNKIDKEQEEEILLVARESVSREKEKEYCMWVKPTAEGWQWLANQAGVSTTDILLPTAGGRRRIRIRPDGAVMTLKKRIDNETVEENSDVGINTALTFYADGNNTHMFKRIRLDPTDEQVAKGAKHWDIDLFYVSQVHPPLPDEEALVEFLKAIGDGSAYGDLVKVELEVEKFFIDSIRDIIPFPVEEAYPSRPKDELVQLMISNYWDNTTAI